MDEQAQIMALKKACAEIIFNINKEAAARVMVSEQKAVALQKDIDFTKQEALRMLLRVKQMSDATLIKVVLKVCTNLGMVQLLKMTSDAEITSFNQSRRIAELEAQLNETEEMILDLRAEISQAHDQLDTVKSSNVRLSSFDEKDGVICCDIAANEDPQITYPLTSPQFNKCHNISKQTPKDVAQVGNFFDYDPNLSSVILVVQKLMPMKSDIFDNVHER
ncbi:hypothetical protein POM88_021457 [Heracleum sosnowskyi]|uniref:Uncharacterized protein n=1 Tax=Heracleum sosnowskyi TaxID=360622 RepID=A0AAD8ID86_9APIA|nr:hypothetical protein POM88_021457 [Heracleum sosnowskyi]